MISRDFHLENRPSHFIKQRESEFAIHKRSIVALGEALMVARNAPRWRKMLVKHGFELGCVNEPMDGP